MVTVEVQKYQQRFTKKTRSMIATAFTVAKA